MQLHAESETDLCELMFRQRVRGGLILTDVRNNTETQEMNGIETGASPPGSTATLDTRNAPRGIPRFCRDHGKLGGKAFDRSVDFQVLYF
jgi:hypothetical protein